MNDVPFEMAHKLYNALVGVNNASSDPLTEEQGVDPVTVMCEAIAGALLDQALCDDDLALHETGEWNRKIEAVAHAALAALRDAGLLSSPGVDEGAREEARTLIEKLRYHTERVRELNAKIHGSGYETPSGRPGACGPGLNVDALCVPGFDFNVPIVINPDDEHRGIVRYEGHQNRPTIYLREWDDRVLLHETLHVLFASWRHEHQREYMDADSPRRLTTAEEERFVRHLTHLYELGWRFAPKAAGPRSRSGAEAIDQSDVRSGEGER